MIDAGQVDADIAHESMIPKSGHRFSGSCSNKKIECDDDSKKSHRALASHRQVATGSHNGGALQMRGDRVLRRVVSACLAMILSLGGLAAERASRTVIERGDVRIEVLA